MGAELAIGIQTLNKTTKDLIFVSEYVTWYDLVGRTSGSNTTGAGTFTLPDGYGWGEAILIGGGGGGGGTHSSGYGGGGGCSGAIITSFIHPNMFVSASPFNYQIGTGGAAGTGGTSPTNGGNGGETYIQDGANILASTGIAEGGKAGEAAAGGDGGGLFLSSTVTGKRVLNGGTGAPDAVTEGGNGETFNGGEYYFGTGGGGSYTAINSGRGGGLSYFTTNTVQGGGGKNSFSNCRFYIYSTVYWSWGGGGYGGVAGQRGILLIYGFRS